jgi:hypothetical protein
MPVTLLLLPYNFQSVQVVMCIAGVKTHITIHVNPNIPIHRMVGDTVFRSGK